MADLVILRTDQSRPQMETGNVQICWQGTRLHFTIALVPALAANLICGTDPARATVLEYDARATPAVTAPKTGQKKHRVRPAVHANETLAQTRLRDLTRSIALRYSSAPGVKNAGLDAPTFADVFEALIERESGFDTQAVSPKGAKGLGQLMPSTARDLNVSNPFDPATNLDGSARYLTAQLQRFGSLELALAAYNSGPSRVVEHAGVPPFAETEAYVAWILEKSGLQPRTVLNPTLKGRQGSPQARSLTTSADQPLQGSLSVWEF